MKLLWLVSWYPNRTEPFAGDFIQRHARAASLYHDIHVIHVVRDVAGTITKDVHIEENREGRLHEQIIYYYSRPGMIPALGKLLSHARYSKLYKKNIEQYLQNNGMPDVVHVHVGMKAGLLALWLQRTRGLPYVVTEHWTGFLPEAGRRLSDLPVYLQKAWRHLLVNAAGVSAVSNYLAQHLQTIDGGIRPVIIPNVVNTDIFFPAKKEKTGVTRFIHISGMDHQKNAEDILKAFALVKAVTGSFFLDVFGPVRKELTELTSGLGLTDHVRFHGEIPQAQLVLYLQQSDALVLYSRYETFGCVIIEANACGIPVIASDIPSMQERIQEGKNGWLVKGGDPRALAGRIISFMQDPPAIDPLLMAGDCAAAYRYSTVGRQLSDWYHAAVPDLKKGSDQVL